MNNVIEKKFLAYLMHDKKYISQSVGKITKKHLPHTYNVYELINRGELKGLKLGRIKVPFFEVERFLRDNLGKEVV